MNDIWKWMKDNVFKQIMVAIALAILTGVWRIVVIISDVPDKFDKNTEDHTAIINNINALSSRIDKKEFEYDESIKSLNRRLTETRTEMFYLKLGEKPPK